MAGRKKTTRPAAGPPVPAPASPVFAQQLLDVCPHLLFAVDRHLRLTAFNRTFARSAEALYGVTPVSGASLLDLFPTPEDITAAQANLARAFAGETVRAQHRLGAPDLHPQTFELTHTPQVGPGGSVESVLIYAENISGLQQTRSELQQARADLRSSEELFETAFLQAEVGVAQISPAGFYLRANPALCSMLGYSEAEMRSRSFNDITAPQDRETSLACWRSMLTGETDTARIEKRLLRKDGVQVWVDVSGRACRAADGSLSYFLAHFVDITRVKQAQNQLDARVAAQTRQIAASEERFSGVLDQMQEGVVLLSFEWRYLYINRAAEVQGRRPKEELLGRTVLECWPNSSGNRLFELEEQVMRERVAGRLEREVPFPDGDTRWFEWRIQPVEQGILIITVDITEHKHAEQILKDSETSLRRIIDTLPGLTWSAQADGSIDFLNQGWLGFTGLTLDQAKGSGWLQALHPDDYADTGAKWSHATRTGSFYEVEQRLRRYDGEYHWFLSRASPVQSGPGLPLKWFGVNADITGRRQAEALARQSHQQLERLAAQVPGMLYQFVGRPDGTYTVTYVSGELHGLAQAPGGSDRSALGRLAALTDPQDAARATALVTASAQSMQPFEIEVRLRLPAGAGEVRWVWASGRPEALPDGSILWSGIAADITERKQLEQSLAESERRFHSVMENMQEGVVLIGFDWRYLYLNPMAEIQGSCRKEDLLGRTVMECWPGIETDPYFLLEQEVMATRVSAQVEGLFNFADGSRHWLQWRIQPSEEGLLVVKVDVTERKLQEAATADSEDRFRLLFNTAIDGIMLSASDHFVASANPAACAILGWTEEELRGVTASQLIDMNDPRAEDLRSIRSRAGASRGEVTMLRKDGTKIPAEVASTVFTDRQGITHASLFFRDISERLRAEEELRRSHRQLETLAAQVPGGLYQFLRRPDGTFSIPFSSAGVRQIFNIREDGSPADLQRLSERIAPDDLARMAAALEESARGMRPFEFEFQVLGAALPAANFQSPDVTAPDSTAAGFWMWASALPEALPDGSVLWSGFTTDITQRKRLEEQVRSSEVKWRSLFEILPVGVAVVDDNGRVTDTNKALSQILDLSEAGILSGNYARRTYVRPDMSEMPAAEFASNRALREQTTVRNVETGVIKEDGAITWTSVSATPLPGGLGSATVTVDITGRKAEQQRTEEALVFSQTIIETSPIGILIYDDAGDCLTSNRAAGEILGVSPAVLRKQNYQRLESWRAGGMYEAAGKALLNKHPVTIQTYVTSTFGRALWLDCTFAAFFNRGKTNLLVMFVDDSERNRAQLSLKVTNEKLLAMVDDLARSNRTADLLRQMSGMLQVCAGMEEAYAVIEQFAPQIFVDNPGALYIPTQKMEIFEAVCSWGANLASELQFKADRCWALRRGQIYTVTAAARAVKCRHVSPEFPGCYLDIPLIAAGETLGLLHLEWTRVEEPDRSSREMAQLFADNISLSFSNIRLRETLHDQSVRDPLTRAFNRRYMEESLERELTRVRRKNGRAGLIMLDIDHFKDFNDTYGHAAGDQLLRQLTDTLQRHVRGDDVVCRMGGEEFLMILPETDGEVTLQRAEIIRAAVQAMNRESDNRLLGPITVSVGVASFPEDGATREELLEKADQAMYRAKRNGRNRVEGAGSLV